MEKTCQVCCLEEESVIAKSGVVGIGCEESRECCFPAGRGLPAHAHYGPKTEKQQETNNKQNKNTGTKSVKPAGPTRRLQADTKAVRRFAPVLPSPLTGC